MPTSLNTLFPFDPSGSVNRVEAESKSVGAGEIIVPDHSPFYITNLIIRDQNGIPLNPTEYTKVVSVNKHILRTSLDAYLGFKVKKAGVTSVTYDYYSVGGDYSINQQAAADLIISLAGVQDEVDYRNLTNIPTSFPPLYHLHAADDISFAGLKMVLMDLAESLAFRDSAVMEQVYQYLDLKTSDIELDVNILNSSQVSIYWKSTGFCICIGELITTDVPGKESYHNFRREFLQPPKIFPDYHRIHGITVGGVVSTNFQEYILNKLTTAGFAFTKGSYTIYPPEDVERGRSMKRLYMAMGISSSQATTSDVPNLIRDYP